MSVTPSSPSVIESPQHTMALGPWTMALPSLPAFPADGRGLAHPASRTEATRIPRQFNSKANGLRILLIQRNPHTRRAGGGRETAMNRPANIAGGIRRLVVVLKV